MHRPTDIRGPTVGIVDAARRRRAANEVVDEVRRNLEDLTARPNDLPKMFAVAAVARAARLVEGMATIQAAGLADVVAIGVRPVLELVIASLHSLTGGLDAVDELRGANVRELKNLSAEVRAQIQIDDLVEGWEGGRERINWEWPDPVRSVHLL